MDGRLGDQGLPPTTPLKPTRHGRGLPLPPLAALVWVAGVLAGLALGYGIAPKVSPLPASSPATANTSMVGPRLPSGSRRGKKPRFDHAARPWYAWIKPPSRSYWKTSRGFATIAA
jgi:hypothetical protein